MATNTHRDGDLMAQYLKDRNTKKEYKDKLKKLYQEKQILLTTHRIKVTTITTERDKLQEKLHKYEEDFLHLKRDRDQKRTANQNLKKEIAKQNIFLKKFKNDNSGNMEIVKKLKKDNRRYKCRIIHAKKEKEKCIAKIENLLKERKTMGDKNKALLENDNYSKSIIENLETQKENLDKELKTKDEKIAYLDNRNMKLSLQVLTIKKELDESTSECERQKNTNNSLTTGKLDLEKELSVQQTIIRNLYLQIEEQATTMAAMKEEINYKKMRINVAFQKSKILDENLKKSHLTNQNVLKALVERDILIEKLNKEDRTETRQYKDIGIRRQMLRRFNKLRAELEVLRKQQRTLVCSGRYISGILQYSKTLLKQAGKEVGGEVSTNIIEQLQLPMLCHQEFENSK